MLKNLKFEVVSYTSEDPSRPASNLNIGDAKNPGWQSEAFVKT